MAGKKKPTGPLKYRDLISKSPEVQQLEERELREQEAKSSLEVSIATTKRDLALAKSRLEATKSAIPYNVSEELKIVEEVEGLERGLAFAERILKERF